MTDTDEVFIRRAIELSRRALEQPGTQPFGAVIVTGGTIVGEGLNRAAARLDPTSHGEIEAIRDACRRLGRTDLSDCDLYTSCEPCPLCVAAMGLAGIRRLCYAASLDQSDHALGGVSPKIRRAIDVADLRRQAGCPVGQGRMPATQLMDADAVAVLEAWTAKQPDFP